MVMILKQGATKKNIQSTLKALSEETHQKGLDAHRYCGKIRLDKDALEIQKDLRNEWE